jgi:hypothetical protein
LNTFINTTETLYPNKPSPNTIYSNIISIGKLKILIIYSHSIFGRKGRKVAKGRFWSLLVAQRSLKGRFWTKMAGMVAKRSLKGRSGSLNGRF